MHADVAQRRGAQYGIDDGMRQNIGVGMPFKAKLAGYGHAAKDERPSGGDAMRVPADAGSNQRPGSFAANSRKNRWAKSISPGLVIFMLRSLPSTTPTSTSSRSTKLDSSVPVKPSFCASSKARTSNA